MTDVLIKDEVLKAVGLLQDKTWTPEDFSARILQLINEEGLKPQFERFLWTVQEMRRLQKRYWNHDKSVLGKCKGMELKVDQHSVQYLKLMGIHNLEQFSKKYNQEQQQIF